MIGHQIKIFSFWKDKDLVREDTIKPLLSPWGAYLISDSPEGGRWGNLLTKSDENILQIFNRQFYESNTYIKHSFIPNDITNANLFR